ncbi:MAG: class I SAM-dependent methyltransferase [Hyphomicrobiaceae bacterium]|nr:class I SAM-dependent methyltransferase [Hyphomicrobiaceae bacterium]
MPQTEIDPKAHWEDVYASKSREDVSWFQRKAVVSMRLIRAAGATRVSNIIDIGGGASCLPRELLDAGFGRITVLDISRKALERARQALADRAGQVAWIDGDIRNASIQGPFDIWHDRAVLHFLTDPADREQYLRVLLGALSADGQAIIATFAPDGPQRCSGLPVMRYDAASIAATLGPHLEVVESVLEDHITPGGKLQRFAWFRLCRRKAGTET